MDMVVPRWMKCRVECTFHDSFTEIFTVFDMASLAVSFYMVYTSIDNYSGGMKVQRISVPD